MSEKFLIRGGALGASPELGHRCLPGFPGLLCAEPGGGRSRAAGVDRGGGGRPGVRLSRDRPPFRAGGGGGGGGPPPTGGGRSRGAGPCPPPPGPGGRGQASRIPPAKMSGGS